MDKILTLPPLRGTSPSSPQTLPSGLCAGAKSNNAPLRSCRRQGNAPPAVKKSPLKKAISKFGVRAQHTVLMRITHASPSSQKSFLQKYFCDFYRLSIYIFRGGRRSLSPFAIITRKKASLRYAFFHPICQPFGLWGKSECGRSKMESPENSPAERKRAAVSSRRRFL